MNVKELLQIMTQEASYGRECPECGGDMHQYDGYEAHELGQYICDDCDYVCSDNDLNL